MAPKVFGSKSALVPFSEPSGEDRDNFAMADHVGRHVLVTFGGIEQIKTNQYGIKDAARVDVAIVDGDLAGHVYEDALVFSAAVVGQVKQYDQGVQFVAKIGSYKSKFGTTGYKFEEPDASGVKAAEDLAG